jgi:DnaJ-class molecular chaperone
VARDPYVELGVAKTASQDEIRRAFRKLAKQLHPDQNPDDKASEERFKRVSAAFDLLSDEEKRRKYDRGELDADGRETFRGFDPRQNGGGPGGFGGRFEGVDLDDIFEMFGRGGAGPGAGASGARGFNPRGQDIRARVEITLEEAILGGPKRIGFSDGRTLDVTIPKGAVEGQTLRLRGQGAPGRGGQNGDALIELVIRPHPLYRREGADLHMDLPVSVPDAVLGAKVQAPTPDGPVMVTVPKGSNSGSTLRLRGRGFTDGKGGRGDLLARLIVTLPDSPDEKLERFAEQWRKERSYTPKARV